MGAAGLIQEAWQDFLSLSHLFFLFCPFIQVKVLTFCKPRLEAMLNGISDMCQARGCPGAALKTKDPRPRLCVIRAGASRRLLPSLPVPWEGGKDGGRER